VNETTLPLLECPSGCGSRLSMAAHSRDGDNIETGTLECPSCSAVFVIEDGIARMLPPSLTNQHSTVDEAVDRKRSEMRARDDQAEGYDRMWYLNLFGLLEIPATLMHLNLAEDHTLLEAGCGTGRMTGEFARRCKRLVSVDYSWESLKSCRTKLQRRGIKSVDLIQADICHLPLCEQAFDRVVSCQVLEHIPTPASRAAAICDLARVLRPGGNLAISAYQYSLWMRLFGQKEGEHAGGIYFYRFEREELRRLLSTAFEVRSMTGALVYHYIARCVKADV
jgi:ubiquinone/menaquinone biosynthesis C-methylase UbiE/uncharacterized protein YbaR (Trm112 family)